MHTPSSSYEIFASIEFDSWAHRDGMSTAERALVEKYLQRDSATVEAGTAGGRIIRGLRDLGFTSLTGFDVVPGLILQARLNDKGGTVKFDIEDATQLSYPDRSFEQAVYLCQFLSMLTGRQQQHAAIAEMARVLKPGGIALLSVCRIDGPTRFASRNMLYRAYLSYLGALRWFRQSRRTRHERPFLKIGNRPNLGALLDLPPYTYWYATDEITGLLRATGFELLWAGSGRDVRENIAPDADAADTIYYIVCRRPG